MAKSQSGIYLAKKPAEKFGGLIEHYGIIEVGNILNLVAADLNTLVVYHQTAEKGFTYEYISSPSPWTIIGRVRNENLMDARSRLINASTEPNYDLWGNNCEHFARYVASGEKTSSQLNGCLAVTGLVAIIWLANNR